MINGDELEAAGIDSIFAASARPTGGQGFLNYFRMLQRCFTDALTILPYNDDDTNSIPPICVSFWGCPEILQDAQRCSEMLRDAQRCSKDLNSTESRSRVHGSTMLGERDVRRERGDDRAKRVNCQWILRMRCG